MIVMAARFFLISIVLSVTLLNADAQEVKFGIKGGLNLANLGGDDAEDLDYRIGLHAGGFVSVPFLEDFRLQPEIVYSQQGAQVDFGDDELKYDYLNIPVIVKFMFTKNFNLQAGPQFGILLAAQQEISGDEVDVKDVLKSTDFGVGLGVGYESSDNVSIDARYNLGITDIVDGGSGDLSFPNQVIQVSLGIAF